jgi:hypothetical protein
VTLRLDRIATQVEKLMLDSLVIKRPTGVRMNELTMEETTEYSAIYTGIGFVVPMGDPAGTTLGAEDVQRIQYEIGVPRTCPQVYPDDVVDVTVSDDSSLVSVGDVFFVHDQIPTTFLTHRRIKAFKDTSAVGYTASG